MNEESWSSCDMGTFTNVEYDTSDRCYKVEIPGTDGDYMIAHTEEIKAGDIIWTDSKSTKPTFILDNSSNEESPDQQVSQEKADELFEALVELCMEYYDEGYSDGSPGGEAMNSDDLKEMAIADISRLINDHLHPEDPDDGKDTLKTHHVSPWATIPAPPSGAFRSVQEIVEKYHEETRKK